jgi:hypothetical protein
MDERNSYAEYLGGTLHSFEQVLENGYLPKEEYLLKMLQAFDNEYRE